MAILSVMAHHIQAYAGFRVPFLGDFGGMLGVQLFFIVSGYLIIQSASQSSAGDYLAHRFFRIFPAYWLVILSVLAMRLVSSPDYRDTFAALKPYFLLNLLNLQQLSLPANAMLDQIHVGWSLTVELMWYGLALALAAVFDRARLQRSAWLWLLAVSSVVSLAWANAAKSGALNFLFQDQFTRLGIAMNEQSAWHLLNGSLVSQLQFFLLGAVIFKYRATLKRVSSSWLWVGLVVGVLLTDYWQGIFGVMPQPVSGLGLGCLFVLLLNCRPLNDPALNFIGKVSYSLYLLHSPVLVVCFLNLKFSGPAPLLACLALTFALAAVLYANVEQPMIQLGRRLTEKRKAFTVSAKPPRLKPS